MKKPCATLSGKPFACWVLVIGCYRATSLIKTSPPLRAILGPMMALRPFCSFVTGLREDETSDKTIITAVWVLVLGVGCLVGCWVLGVGRWALGVGCYRVTSLINPPPPQDPTVALC